MVGVGQSGRHLERGHGAHLPVVVPARGDGVDVRPEQERRPIGLGAGAPPDQIARQVDGDLEPGSRTRTKTHSRAAMPASLLGDPADSALGRGAEAGQVDERLVEASPVDQEVGRRGRISDAAHRERRGSPAAIHQPADGSSGGVTCPPRRGRKQPERDTSGRKAIELTAHGLPG